MSPTQGEKRNIPLNMFNFCDLTNFFSHLIKTKLVSRQFSGPHYSKMSSPAETQVSRLLQQTDWKKKKETTLQSTRLENAVAINNYIYKIKHFDWRLNRSLHSPNETKVYISQNNVHYNILQERTYKQSAPAQLTKSSACEETLGWSEGLNSAVDWRPIDCSHMSWQREAFSERESKCGKWSLCPGTFKRTLQPCSCHFLWRHI